MTAGSIGVYPHAEKNWTFKFWVRAATVTVSYRVTVGCGYANGLQLTLWVAAAAAPLSAGTPRQRTHHSCRGTGGRSRPRRRRWPAGVAAKWSSSDPCLYPRSRETSSGLWWPSSGAWQTQSPGPRVWPGPAEEDKRGAGVESRRRCGRPSSEDPRGRATAGDRRARSPRRARDCMVLTVKQAGLELRCRPGSLPSSFGGSTHAHARTHFTSCTHRVATWEFSARALVRSVAVGTTWSPGSAQEPDRSLHGSGGRMMRSGPAR